MASESWGDSIEPGVAGTYVIYHIGSSKRYVGSATDIRRRRSEHWRELQRGDHDNEHLQRAWNKYGPGAFEFRIVEVCQASEVIAREQCLLDAEIERVGWRSLYNQSRTAGSRLGVRHTESTKEKMRKNNSRHFMGKTHTKETRELISMIARERWLNPAYRAKCSGVPMSPERKKKIGDANRGRTVSADVRAKISASSKGRRLSPDHKAKLVNSARFSGRRHTDKSKSKIALALCGRVFSEETRKKISDGVRRWRASRNATISSPQEVSQPCQK